MLDALRAMHETLLRGQGCSGFYLRVAIGFLLFTKPTLGGAIPPIGGVHA